MGKASSGGQMAKNITVNSRKTSVMVKENSDGRMAANTKESGLEENSMA